MDDGLGAGSSGSGRKGAGAIEAESSTFVTSTRKGTVLPSVAAETGASEAAVTGTAKSGKGGKNKNKPA